MTHLRLHHIKIVTHSIAFINHITYTYRVSIHSATTYSSACHQPARPQMHVCPVSLVNHLAHSSLPTTVLLLEIIPRPTTYSVSSSSPVGASPVLKYPILWKNSLKWLYFPFFLWSYLVRVWLSIGFTDLIWWQVGNIDIQIIATKASTHFYSQEDVDKSVQSALNLSDEEMQDDVGVRIWTDEDEWSVSRPHNLTQSVMWSWAYESRDVGLEESRRPDPTHWSKLMKPFAGFWGSCI